METNSVLKNAAINQINAYKAADKFYDHKRMVQHVYDQFSGAIMKCQYENHRENISNYKMFCEGLLVLLTNPKISSKLKGIFQKKAGDLLFNMINFFEYVEEDPMCNVEFDLYEVNNNHLSDIDLQHVIDKYQKKIIEKAA
ncbi:MAG TPA: hypothetical protein VFW07_01440 [Parafilimonas sp.]|nr:hypothetical protein [Parafilimonas sp.]